LPDIAKAGFPRHWCDTDGIDSAETAALTMLLTSRHQIF
jgi:hypothetical protein